VIDACNNLSLTSLNLLSIKSLWLVPKTTWLSAFGNLTSLRTVHVCGPPAIGLISALSIGSGNLAEECLPRDDTKKIFLPNLLNLQCTSMCRAWSFSSTRNFSKIYGTVWCHWDSEVLGLHLVCSKEYFDQVELLRETVVNVNWANIRCPWSKFGFSVRAIRERI
jgi:hypothetical protein